MSLALPEYWASVTVFDVTNYDAAFISKYPSATKQKAHAACRNHLKILRKKYKEDRTWRVFIKKAIKELKTSRKSSANATLWEEAKENLSDAAVKRLIQEAERKNAVEELVTTAIITATKTL